ncbi:MAG TPA: MarR family transcriptional regulator [Solirubrobacterales bacterium]|nr:MarR family transcriptional regulator [Solirubrobacterales bacterium]
MSPKRRTKAELIGELGLAFRREQNRNQAFDERAAERLGINLTDLRCIDIIEQHAGESARPGADGDEARGITAGELAAAAHLTTGAVTAVIDRLERAGYARRVRDRVDRRRIRIELTPKARRETAEIYGPRGWAFHRLFERYTVAELELVLDLIRRSAEVGADELARLGERPERSDEGE